MSAVMTASRLRPEDEHEPEPEQPLSYAEEVGRRIVQARRELGLTQVQLAQKIGVSQRSAQAYENGETVPYRQMKKLARALKRRPEWILEGDEGLESARLTRIEGQLDELTSLLRALTKKMN